MSNEYTGPPYPLEALEEIERLRTELTAFAALERAARAIVHPRPGPKMYVNDRLTVAEIDLLALGSALEALDRARASGSGSGAGGENG